MGCPTYSHARRTFKRPELGSRSIALPSSHRAFPAGWAIRQSNFFTIRLRVFGVLRVDTLKDPAATLDDQRSACLADGPRASARSNRIGARDLAFVAALAFFKGAPMALAFVAALAFLAGNRYLTSAFSHDAPTPPPSPEQRLPDAARRPAPCASRSGSATGSIVGPYSSAMTFWTPSQVITLPTSFVSMKQSVGKPFAWPFCWKACTRRPAIEKGAAGHGISFRYAPKASCDRDAEDPQDLELVVAFSFGELVVFDELRDEVPTRFAPVRREEERDVLLLFQCIS